MPTPTHRRSVTRIVCCLAVFVLTTSATASLHAADQSAATQPADTQPAHDIDPRADKWLTRIEQRADKIDTMQVKLRYDRIKGLLGSKQRWFGTLKYKAGSPAHFAVHFNKRIEGNTARDLDRTYIFDGRWLAEVRADEKIFIRRELAPAGEQKQSLAIDSQGPFVLPLDQDKEYVLDRFKVRFVPEAADDPDQTIHLQLTPRPGKGIDLKQVDLWYDKQSLLPKRAVSRKGGPQGAADKSVLTVLDVNQKANIADDAFDTMPPEQGDWEVQIKRLGDPRRSGPIGGE
jgi:hypothetical protein